MFLTSSLEKSVFVRYRRKGKERTDSVESVGILGDDRNTIEWCSDDQVGNLIDLTKVPVIGIGGKRKYQPGKVRDFLDKNSEFQGGFLLYGGSGSWDIGGAILLVTSQEILAGKKVSGGKPEVILTDYRWERDGRYVARRVKQLHGRTIEVLEDRVEADPGASVVAEEMVYGSLGFHLLHEKCRVVGKELSELEARRVARFGEEPRNMVKLLRDLLERKLKEAGVRTVADIPEDLSVSAEEVAPDLVARADSAGIVEVPGIGGRRVETLQSFEKKIPFVTVQLDELNKVTDWPHEKLGVIVPEFDRAIQTRAYQHGVLEDIFFKGKAEGRWDRFLVYAHETWAKEEWRRSRPAPAKGLDTPPLIEPRAIAISPVTGEELMAYPYLQRSLKDGRMVWEVEWTDSWGLADRLNRTASALLPKKEKREERVTLAETDHDDSEKKETPASDEPVDLSRVTLFGRSVQ